MTADVRPSFVAVRMINLHEMDNIDIEDVVDLVKKQYNIKSSFSLQRTTLDANGEAEPALTQPAQLTLKPLAIATFKLKLTN